MRTGLLSLILAVFSINISHADELVSGQVPPAFELIDQNGRTHSLEDYLGKWVVLYFYPKDDTPGCTKEACNFRDDISRLDALRVQVLGISLDSAESHAQFAEKYGLRAANSKNTQTDRTLVGELDRIVHQVDQDLAQMLVIPLEGERRVWIDTA